MSVGVQRIQRVSAVSAGGPLAAIDPPLKISAKAEGADVGSGRLSFKLPEKIKCDGTWTAVVPKVVSESSGLSLTLKGPGANVDNKSESVPGVNSGEIYAFAPTVAGFRAISSWAAARPAARGRQRIPKATSIRFCSGGTPVPLK